MYLNVVQDAVLCMVSRTSGLQTPCQLDVPMNSTDRSAYMAQQCSPGYYGPVCSLCVTEGPQRYGRSGVVQCQACRSAFKIVVTYLANGFLVLAFLMYVIYTTLQENEVELAHGQQDVQPTELLKVILCPWPPNPDPFLSLFPPPLPPSSCSMW